MSPGQSRSFKSDESFLEKVAIGAIGTRKVFEHLQQQGQIPVALDRGSMSYKLWKAIKIKRLRVPDILCVATGIKVESRAKTKLEISMSHSTSDPQRGWDFGLDDRDYVALPLCTKTGEEPIAWTASDLVQYVSISDLREAFSKNRVIQERPKGAQEGFETRLTWPASVASADGRVSEITDSRLKFRRTSDNRTISLALEKKGISLEPQVRPDDQIREGQLLCSVVPICQGIPLTEPVDRAHYLNMLSSPSLSDRYAAAKALATLEGDDVQPALASVMSEAKEHIYVKLEAAAALMKRGAEQGVDFLMHALEDEYLEHRLEAVIVLGEVHLPRSSEILIDCLLDRDQHAEIRAGAAWALGELGSRSALDSLVRSFQEVELSIRVEATRALAKLAREHQPDILAKLPLSEPNSRPGIAWAVAQVGGFSIEELLPLRVDEDARQWIAYMIGTQPQENYAAEVARLKSEDPEIHFAANVLWKILTSWINGLKEY